MALSLVDLRAHGIKLTGQRRLIFEFIARAADHLCTHEIHAAVMHQRPHISLATVYRTLRVLRDAGVVEEHRFGEARCQYELASGQHHDHLIDQATGDAIEFFDSELEELQRRVAQRLGYRLVHHQLTLFGRKLPPEART